MIDKKDEIMDLYSMHLWSGDNIPWTELVPLIKRESTSESSLYDIACFIVELHKEQTDEG